MVLCECKHKINKIEIDHNKNGISIAILVSTAKWEPETFILNLEKTIKNNNATVNDCHFKMYQSYISDDGITEIFKCSHVTFMDINSYIERILDINIGNNNNGNDNYNDKKYAIKRLSDSMQKKMKFTHKMNKFI